ncbi:hypothetical protein PQR15_10950 [Streptomyces lydicus]|nr:hypothetical protein [Streptomyces lydicus]
MQAGERVVRVGAEVLRAGGTLDQVLGTQPAQRGDGHREPDVVLLVAALDDADHLAAVAVEQRPAGGAGSDPDVAAELQPAGVPGAEPDGDERVDRGGGRRVPAAPHPAPDSRMSRSPGRDPPDCSCPRKM